MNQIFFYLTCEWLGSVRLSFSPTYKETLFFYISNK